MGKFRQKRGLEGAREIQRDWLKHGLNFVHYYIDDVEGDWLENWGKDSATSSTSQVNTRQWLQGVFEQGWRSLESLFNDYQLNLVPTMTRDRQTEPEQVKAVKPLHFDVSPIPKVFALLVVRSPVEDGKVKTQIQLHPMGKKGKLPQGIALRALDEDDELIQDPVISGKQDNLIQLKALTAPPETPLKLQVVFQEITKTENLSL